MRAQLPNIIRVVIALAALGLVVLILRDVDLQQTLTILLSANPFFLLITFVFQLTTLLARTVRWKYSLQPVKDLPVATLFPPLIISFAVGNVTVTGVGAIPRVYLLNRRTHINSGFIIGTLIQELVLDGSAIFIWALLVPFFIQLTPQFRVVQLFLILPVVLILLIDLAMVRHRSLLIGPLMRLGLWDRILSMLPDWARNNIESIGLGMGAAFSAMKTTIAVVGLTALIWIMESIIFWLLALSLGLPLDYLAATAVTAYTNAVISVVVVPGFLGTLELSTIGLVLALGMTGAAALAYTELVRLFLIGPSTLIGAFFAWREGFRWGKD